MLKDNLILLLFTLCSTQVNSEVNLKRKHTNTDTPQESKNLPPLLTLQTGNPIHLTKQEQNNNFYLIPFLKPKLNVQTIEVHQYDPNENVLKTIIILPPKTKKPCDRNSSVSQPPVTTEKPTITQPCDNIKTTKNPTTSIKTTTVSQITKKPCELTTTDITPTSSTTTEVTKTPATKLTPNPNEVTPNPNEVTPHPNEVTRNPNKVTPNPNKVTRNPNKVTPNPNDVTRNPNKVTPNPNDVTRNPNKVTPNPNDITPTAIIERTTRGPVTGDPDGSTKCLRDGVYRASNVTCDQFYVCIHGIQYLMDCPYGLVFNEQLKICDWLENVADCKPPAFKDITCPDEGYGIDGNLILQFRYRDSCSQFISCHKRKARLLSCEPGYYFHEEPSKCMNFRSNSNCRDVWYSY